MQTNGDHPIMTANFYDDEAGLGEAPAGQQGQRMDIDVEQLRELMRAIEEFGINELEIEQGEARVVVRRGVTGAAAQQAVVPQAVPAAPAGQPAAPAPSGGNDASGSAQPTSQAEEEEDPNVVYVTSPFVGTFYRAPSPTDAPYVEPGSDVEAGQTLCIVEAMKLMNEIESELSCTILEILVENGKPVEYGDRLFKVRKK